MPIDLKPARAADASILDNLMELYCHDLSPYFGLKIGSDGRYGYPYLPRYWTEPGLRFPFFVTVDDELAGFVLVTRGSPASAEPTDLDVAEFFVLKTFRRSGVGARAAHLLWARLPGHWIVRVAVQNESAVQFWRHAVRSYAQGAPTVERRAVLSGVERLVLEVDTAFSPLTT